VGRGRDVITLAVLAHGPLRYNHACGSGGEVHHRSILCYRVRVTVRVRVDWLSVKSLGGELLPSTYAWCWMQTVVLFAVCGKVKCGKQILIVSKSNSNSNELKLRLMPLIQTPSCAKKTDRMALKQQKSGCNLLLALSIMTCLDKPHNVCESIAWVCQW